MSLKNVFLGVCACALMSAAAVAAEPQAADGGPDAEAARALLAKAVTHYRDSGNKDAALAAFSRQGEFVQGDLYVYVLDVTGRMLASGGSSSLLVGRDVSLLKDASGKLFFQEMLSVARDRGEGSVDYRWLNRTDSKVERKRAYFQKAGDRIFAVGYYMPRATKEQARALLQRTAEALKAEPDATISAINDPSGGKYLEDDLYVFVVSLQDKHFRAHGAMPRLIGANAAELADPNGKLIIRDMISQLRSKTEGELDYSWRNPVTGKVEKKHTYLRKVGDLMVGVGYYAR